MMFSGFLLSLTVIVKILFFRSRGGVIMGDAHRIPKAKDKKFSDPEFEVLLRIKPNRLKHNLSLFFTRPAYQYTVAEVGGIN